MFQTFETTSSPQDGPPRLAALRAEMGREGLDGFLVPRADAYQGEYVAPCDERLAWLTGFTGSAGFCIALQDRAGVFVDGRYRVQVRAQVADVFTPVNWPEVHAAEWLKETLAGGTVGYDPWLHTVAEIEGLTRRLEGSGIELRATANLVDRIWADRPAPPAGKAAPHDATLAGRSAEEKIADLAATLRENEQDATVLAQPDGVAWLLNLRGEDIPRIPIVQAFALLTSDCAVTVFADPQKFDLLSRPLGFEVEPADRLLETLGALEGTVRLDRATTPARLADALTDGPAKIVWADEITSLPKARKSPAEIEGARAAHLRDGAAMAEFLCWLDNQTPDRFTEIDVVKALEGFRQQTNALRDISFETISGSGPNGAIVHYRVTEETDRTVGAGELLLVDSGGQYVDGTTDITRTVAIGAPAPRHVEAFTQVLRGMIAISLARFPKGLAGRDLDPLARLPLWQAGRDYDHGTGHGVGSYLSVHEGPQRISRKGEVALEPGMILSNEPGYYREGDFGIRIENLIVVQAASPLEGGDARAMLDFETLTLAPIDRRLIDPDALTAAERAWLDAYHARVLTEIGPLVTPPTRDWLTQACSPL